ncbi:Cystathionine beta-lyase family protein involved in aluminum resistance [Sporobacter termitidis DSM 10068]|uniref:Cystathionine beta-lyase family protein involved in aluminum resistance n=1 Tax=Sporobacter termitidis DSM 10068 TaxID=1123282 RepID=A0A1M5UF95_9FIRM|nr:methionine gamma-lyase family protein [Sporobacter termitidis]SHH61725.1 Cystathionine beta-lyase family protein involved in aluminum resistance [Sporobacter termitidis DSM 10068]
MGPMELSPEIRRLSEKAMADIEPAFKALDRLALENTEKVLSAFQKHRVSEACLTGTTGYGYNDKGRDTLDLIYADVFGAESALVRIGFVNGTHAITAALFGAMVTGDILLSATGTPYDTLRGAIGIEGDYRGSLRDYGVGYAQTDLMPDGTPDYDAVARAAADKRVAAVLVQRSSGYSARSALTMPQIGKICDIVHAANDRAAVIVDNCYGEFTGTTEPTQVGADLMAGSLIKNPGGGLAPTGGYVAGRKDLVEAAAYRLTSPGIGGECGASLFNNRLLYQGFFMAPHTVSEALKTAIFCARLLELMGYGTLPAWDATRSDIIQMVQLGDPELLQRFCRGIQAGAPVDAYVSPEPWDMPGYGCQVIMAAGTFVQGASIELSADGPMRAPYCAYLQGGLTFEAGRLGIMTAADMLRDK